MSYLVLARKWRPQGFDAITGQEHVTRTLENAIEQGRVHHAFVFCGARGVGKTTAARVLARALNCRAGEGPTTKPCGTCEACTEIAAGTSLDVFEIDGASNRGINEIRELRDGVAYAPQRDRHKIYIIDEVHMLTTEAFNALLKTLEEPPSHVKFIFATTEPHKIPVTILSRCQRFDFKRIPRDTMVGYLTKMLTNESIQIDPAGLRLVARESEGSMRDALSLLDRIISFCGTEATHEQVAEVLGVADRGWLHRVIASAVAQDAAGALSVVEEIFTYGLDLRQFTTDLVHYLRDVIVLKVAGADAGLTDLSPEETGRLVALGQTRSLEDFQRMAQVLVRAAERLAHANFPRLEVEMAVIRLSRMRALRPLDELVDRLGALEHSLSTGAPLPVRAPAVAPAGAALPAATLASASPSGVQPARPTPTAAPAPRATPPSTPDPVVEAHARAESSRPEALSPVVAAPDAAAKAVASNASHPGPTSVLGRAAFSNDGWEAFVERVRADHAALAGHLDHGHVVGLSEGVLRLQFNGPASAERVRSDLETVQELIGAAFDGIVALKIEADQGADDTPFQRRQEREDKAREARRQGLRDHPLVAAVIARFDGTLAGVVLHARPGDPEHIKENPE